MSSGHVLFIERCKALVEIKMVRKVDASSTRLSFYPEMLCSEAPRFLSLCHAELVHLMWYREEKREIHNAHYIVAFKNP